jgi:predicted carbohydrate-binding protein with CBM5 and CBM33 domain
MTVLGFSGILALEAVLSSNYMYEKRLINDSNGNLLYVGFNQTANALTASNTWYILKMSYDGNGFLNRVQLPDLGIGFNYIFDDIASYFS